MKYKVLAIFQAMAALGSQVPRCTQVFGVLALA
jgi:hypothetical protein